MKTQQPRPTIGTFSRRRFVGYSAGIAAGCSLGLPAWAIDCTNTHPGNELRLPPNWTNGDDLIVAPDSLEIFPGHQTSVFSINGAVPGPTIRLTRGETFNARVVNNLTDQDLVLHWHGLLAPERQDGHPRDQVAPGESYDLSYKINQRGSTCWYHSHTDHLTAEQVYLGLAGFFIIDDPEHDALNLPSGDHDIPLVISDWRSNADFQLTYAPGNMDLMRGYLGDTPLINGTPDAYLCVDQDLHRFRILNGSNARIYKLAFSDGRPFHLIGSDAGLVPEPVEVTSAILAPGQRLEILVDFANIAVGGSVVLRSLGVPTDVGTAPTQSDTFDLMTFYVEQAATAATPPAALIPIAPFDPADAVVSRQFVISNSGTTHYINGLLFELERIDFEPTQGKLELWEYQNTGSVYHPMHMHAAHFQVLERVGGSLMPEDGGWKDTVLVYPNETVRLLVRFDNHPGKFLHHCHNLEHEDNGMMQNFNVLPFANADLQIAFDGSTYTVSWLEAASGSLESTADLAAGTWTSVSQTPVLVNGRQTVTIPASGDNLFFRLALR